MMRLKYIAVAFCLAAGLTSSAGATDFAHDGVIDIFAALGVAETTELDFGAAEDADGTITLDISNTITADPAGIHQGGTVASGGYTISGEPSQVVAVVLTGSTASGLTIGTFTTDQADLNNVPLGVGGSVLLTIGADLTVASAAAAPGANQLLAFTIAVTYN